MAQVAEGFTLPNLREDPIGERLLSLCAFRSGQFSVGINAYIRLEQILQQYSEAAANDNNCLKLSRVRNVSLAPFTHDQGGFYCYR